jgi:hypothetical protein
MGGLDWIVIAAGIAAIVWVNWYFLFAPVIPRPSSLRSSSAGFARQLDRND